MKNNGKLYRFVMLFFATGAGTGYTPIVPGTIGTMIAGIPLYLLLSGLTSGWYAAVVLVFFVFSVFFCEAGERVLGEKDSRKIVIDEVCGYLVTMAFVPMSVSAIVAGFFLFRFFDIVKLQPAKWLEDNLPGGMGVLFDDVAAGIYANISLHLLLWIAGDRLP